MNDFEKSLIRAKQRVLASGEGEATARYNHVMLMAMLACLAGCYDHPSVTDDETPEQRAVLDAFSAAACSEMKLSRNALVRYLMGQAAYQAIEKDFVAGLISEQEAVALLDEVQPE